MVMRRVLIVEDHVKDVLLVSHALDEMIVIEAVVWLENALVSVIDTNHCSNLAIMFLIRI